MFPRPAASLKLLSRTTLANSSDYSTTRTTPSLVAKGIAKLKRLHVNSTSFFSVTVGVAEIKDCLDCGTQHCIVQKIPVDVSHCFP